MNYHDKNNVGRNVRSWIGMSARAKFQEINYITQGKRHSENELGVPLYYTKHLQRL